MLKSSSTAARLPAQLTSSTSTVAGAEAYRGAPTQTKHSLALVRWLFPSLTDMIFVGLVSMLLFAPIGAGLLNDADTGWHIRNGQHIARTLSVPHTDDFSYTMSGKPWYAWEWMYDALAGVAEARLGLNGIVLFTAVVIACTFALLFRSLVVESGDWLVSALLTLLAVLSAQASRFPQAGQWIEGGRRRRYGPK